MFDAPLAPTDSSITYAALERDPYPIYRRLRREAPVLRVKAVGRVLLTKAADTRFVKENAALFSSDDPNTPMRRAFLAHTLMRKDGDAHRRERMAMASAFSPRAVKTLWMPRFEKVARSYVAALPRGETVDFFETLAAPYAARCLAIMLGIPEATDAEIAHWSQTLIDGAGNFSGRPELFEACDRIHEVCDATIERAASRLRAEPDGSALSFMINADEPIEWSQIKANIKIAIGGGVNEPRDALNTVLIGLLSDRNQLDACRAAELWANAFEEAVRWVAPIQVSSRLVTEDVEIRGVLVRKGETVMTAQASANRDEEVWGEAEGFNMFRKPLPHQAFGNGAHFCLGAHAARKMVGEIMLPLLFDRFPNLSIPDPGAVEWKGFGFRGPVKLPIRLN